MRRGDLLRAVRPMGLGRDWALALEDSTWIISEDDGPRHIEVVRVVFLGSQRDGITNVATCDWRVVQKREQCDMMEKTDSL